MTQILFKITLIGLIVTAITTFVASMPNAEPLPIFIQSTIEWLFTAMYIFDPVLDVPAFFECVYILAQATIWFFIALGFIKMVKWALLAAN